LCAISQQVAIFDGQTALPLQLHGTVTIGYARAMREVIAKRIIETAQRGAKDSTARTDDAVQFFSTNYNYGLSGPDSETALKAKKSK
jgi:hypothetical protein